VVDRDGMHEGSPGKGRGSTAFSCHLDRHAIRTRENKSAPILTWDRSAGRSAVLVLHANAQSSTCRETHATRARTTHRGPGESHESQTTEG